jgi:uncharacterized phage protein (TIGR01671 family)
MREIKFRAWRKKFKYMLSKEELAYKDGKFCHIFNCDFMPMDDDFVVMQYTGLKDKKGIEIYEGDIVKLHAQERLAEMIGYIIYGTYGNLCCQFVCSDNMYGGGYRNLTEYEIIEVIGNVYQTRGAHE